MNTTPYAAAASANVVPLSRATIVVVALTALAAAVYFPWRLATFNPNAWLLSIALYAAELFGLVSMILHGFMVWRRVERKAPTPPPDITVDVFIPTYNEPVEMLRRTLVAALGMNYPHETWLLDDGDRPGMAALAQELGVRYLARRNNEHAKAGNLNHALAHSRGELIAIFDADHVPHRDYLVRTLGYFAEPDVAFVQTPQDFHNLDSFQHRRSSRHNTVWTEQSLFFRVIMPGKDYWNAAFFCGSCATVRRSAVESIGGFATETVTEDLHTSIRLHKKGYRSVYHSESLAYGVAPDTFEPYQSQRIRWGQGAMQVWRMEGMLSARGLSLPQRLCYLASAMTYFDSWQKALMYLLPGFSIATGILPVAALNARFALFFLPWFVLSLWTSEELGRGYARSGMIEQYNFLRFPGFLIATLTFFVNRRLRFKVTKKVGGSHRENIGPLLVHLAFLAVMIALLTFGVGRFVLARHMPLGAFVLNFFWAVVVTSVGVSALVFALQRTKQERSAYRFRLPLPVLLTDHDGKDWMLVSRNVSSGGFHVLIHAALAAADGERLSADLILPSGRQRVGLEVRRRWQTGRGSDDVQHHLAVRFLWQSPGDADALNRQLYGSNAEWLMSGLSDRGPTPMKRLLSAFRGAPRVGHPHIADFFAALALPTENSYSIDVLVALGPDGTDLDLLIANRPLVKDTMTVITAQPELRVTRYRIAYTLPRADTDQMMFEHKLTRVVRAEAGPLPSRDMQRPLSKGAAA